MILKQIYTVNNQRELIINLPERFRKKKRLVVILDDSVDSTDQNYDEADEEKLWMKAVSSNPAFDFLKEPEEDIYTLADGEPYND